MYQSPYQVPAFSKYVFEKTGQAIRRLEMDEKMVTLTPTKDVVAVPPDNATIPPFTLFITKDQVPTMETQIAVDGRLLLKPNGQPIKQDMLDFYVLASKLILKWRTEGEQDEFTRLGGGLLPQLFGIWVKNNIAGRLGLDFKQASSLQATAVGFYLQSCDPLTNNSSGGTVDGYLNRISRAIPGVDVFTLTNSLLNNTHPVLNNLTEYVDWAKSVIDSPRMENFSTTMLSVVLANTWLYSSKDVTIAAIEYPPLFAAIVYTCLKSQGFMKTQIGDMIKRQVKPMDASNYLKSVDRFLLN